MASPGARFVLLSLDGLSGEQWTELSRPVPALGKLLAGGTIVDLHSDTPPSFEPVWAEVLTGRPWWEVDCPGHGRPGSSLKLLARVDEDGLRSPVSLLPDEGAVCASVPLLKARPGRMWLSDGAGPSQVVVGPGSLAFVEPFASYVPRPFSSSLQALATVEQCVREVVEGERIRIACVRSLLQDRGWRFAVARLTVFDQLSHLLGPDFLNGRALKCWGAVESFLDHFGSFLEHVVDGMDDVEIGLLSTFAHGHCLARVNLNALLSGGGFAVVEPSTIADGRLSVVRAVAAARGEPAEGASPMVSPELLPVVDRLRALPPAVIDVNRKSRFEDGTVDDADVPELLSAIESYLRERFEKALGESKAIFRRVSGEGAPDLVVTSPGVEFHNTATPSSIDSRNKPVSTHIYRGSVLLPGALVRDRSPMTAVELHDLLEPFAHACAGPRP